MYIHKVNPRLLNPCIYCSPSLTNVQPGETRLNQVWYCWALSESSAKVGVETCSAISFFPCCALREAYIIEEQFTSPINQV